MYFYFAKLNLEKELLTFNAYYVLLKFLYSEKATKIWRTLETFFELTKDRTNIFRHIFVAFSEYMDFIQNTKSSNSTYNYWHFFTVLVALWYDEGKQILFLGVGGALLCVYRLDGGAILLVQTTWKFQDIYHF